MKSAYELAMERLAKSDPDATKPLSPGQKQEIADIEKRYKSQWAEREISLKQRIAEAEAQGNLDEVEAAQEELRRERARIDEDMEDAKEKVRRQS